MALKTQRWEPDTCADPSTGNVCILEETWDDTVPAESRTHTFLRAIKLCTRHSVAHGTNYLAAHTANHQENDRKNISLRAAVTVKSDVNLDNISWSFDAAGVLTINCGNELTNQQKSQLQNIVDVQFGVGKVVII